MGNFFSSRSAGWWAGLATIVLALILLVITAIGFVTNYIGYPFGVLFLVAGLIAFIRIWQEDKTYQPAE